MTASFASPLAALTTVFTPPCATSWLLTTTKAPSQYPPFPTTGPSSCDPPFWAENLSAEGFHYYSPAICPSGFVVGPGCEITKTRTAEGFPAVEDGETAVYCVPSGQSCTTDTTDFRGGVWGAVTNDGVFTVGPALQIRFREEDLTSLETHPLTPGLSLADETSAPVAMSTPGTTEVESNTSSTTTDEPASTTFLVGGFTTIPKATSVVSVSVITTVSSVVVNTERTSVGTDIIATVRTVDTTLVSTRSDVDTQSTSSSSSPSSTTALHGLGSPQASGNKKDNVNTTSLAAIVPSGTLIAVVAGILAFLFARRYRRKRNNDYASTLRTSRLSAVGVGVWIRRSRKSTTEKGLPSTTKDLESQKHHQKQPKVIDRELITTHPETSELSAAHKPLGTRENPAELEATEAAVRLSRSFSWMSRVSRMLSKAAGAQGSMTLSTTRASSLTSASRWTRQSEMSMQTGLGSGSGSGDWEAFVRERWPGGLTVPAGTYEMPGSVVGEEDKGEEGGERRVRGVMGSSSRNSHGGGGGVVNGIRDLNRAKSGKRLDVDKELPRLSKFSRLSDGTFGGVLATSPRSPRSPRRPEEYDS
ncbi:uncharacterized protein BCR38DRAFT_477100 [Pseudomassariella vexata]|uniref:Uncharacterized protein n=1 Tax=Pseudomassariella vexata TaxID=1141098 RepID=A0A1Y2DLV6_9PEZI|nr:uncharacterized protein BCR38DRAFT_477100 [Pseudomassariella vexata]ORY60288.1 hypothetical protein BCR38DRAFT_477100 [Pseudomassariella vexata]